MALASDAASASGPVNGCYLAVANPAQLYLVTKAGSSCPQGWTLPRHGHDRAAGAGQRRLLPEREPHLKISGGDEVACQFAPFSGESSVQQIGPPANTMFESMALNGAVFLDAGQAPLIACIDFNTDPTTQLAEGNLNAILISSSKGAVSNAAAAQPSSRKLTIVRP